MPAEKLEKPRFYIDHHDERPELFSLAGGILAAISTRCPGKDSANQDSAVLVPVSDQSGVLAVADGVGGAAAGDRAARRAVEVLADEILKIDPHEQLLRTAILNGIERANQEILSWGVGAATTLAVVEINQQSVRPYHVGDSEILIVGGRGKVKLQTISHGPVAYGVESGLIDETDALRHEHRNIVSNILGATDMRIEIGPTIKLSQRDTILVASDGVCDNARIQDIIPIIRKGDLFAAAEQLVQLIQQRMRSPAAPHPTKPDDATFCCFRLQ